MMRERKKTYEPPKLITYSREEILAGLGPARAIYGLPGGAD